MVDADDALESLCQIQEEFKLFCQGRGRVSEADTRAKVVDRILRDVLGWDEGDISREEHVENGFVDYLLTVRGKKLLAVEAKREGVSFQIPTDITRRTYKLNGSLLTDSSIRDAVHQVRQYCDDAGIRYAIATNGYAWIALRAVRDDIPWRQGNATVFPSLDSIRDNFTSFWNLLSKQAVHSGSLHVEFDSALRVSRKLHRVIDRLFNADLPLRRNRLNNALQPLIKLIFEDIADQGQIEVLQSCYVHSQTITGATEYLDQLIADSIPRFLVDEGAEPVQGTRSSRGFEGLLHDALIQRRGELILLLGGIGSGKTTFLKRYQRTTGCELLNAHSLWFPVDFLKAPLDPSQLEDFVWRSLLEDLRSRYSSLELEKRKHLHEVFASNIEALRATVLADIRKGSKAYDRTLSPFLLSWQQQLNTYVPQLLRASCVRKRLIPVLFIDNVDQLSPSYQSQIFLLAQRVTRMMESLTVVALREESYYTASVQRSFTAYSSRKFHIASPLFRVLIGSRIRYALRLLETGTDAPSTLPTQPADALSIRNYLTIVESSLFGPNRRIARMIEAICYGNMRLALELFSIFLTSGATDVDKMLRIHERDGAYHVAFHEFVKAVMLRDRRYYKEDHSPIMNVFGVGAERNSSHFTALRVLRVLLALRGEATSEGRGYVELGRLVNEFETICDNREDLIATLDRLITRQLVEVDTRSTETVEGASHVRVTSAGWFYFRHLVRSFSYLDLVLQDTPIDDAEVESQLRDSVYQVDNLSDRDDQKLERIRVRFARVRTFLDYLRREEDSEWELYQLESVPPPIGTKLMPEIVARFQRDEDWIDRRLRENRERFHEEAVEETPAEEAEMLELLQGATEIEVEGQPPTFEANKSQRDKRVSGEA